MTLIKMFSTPTRLGLVAGTALLGSLAFAGQAEASKITFTFDCVITGPNSCTGGGAFGTVTLTDSLVDTNRVDVNVVLNAANIQAQNDVVNGLNDLFLNYSGPNPANTSFKLVEQADPFGTFNGTAGSGEINLNNKGPLGTTLDIDFDPAGSTPSWTYSGSILLRLDGGVHTEINLDASMFYLKDANSLLYAGFDTLPTNHKFFGGSTAAVEEGVTAATPVPEPTSLFLLGSGLLFAVRYATRRTPKA